MDKIIKALKSVREVVENLEATLYSKLSEKDSGITFYHDGDSKFYYRSETNDLKKGTFVYIDAPEGNSFGYVTEDFKFRESDKDESHEFGSGFYDVLKEVEKIEDLYKIYEEENKRETISSSKLSETQISKLENTLRTLGFNDKQVKLAIQNTEPVGSIEKLVETSVKLITESPLNESAKKEGPVR